jgi:hypothetical protein
VNPLFAKQRMCTRSPPSNGKRVYSERISILGLKKLPSCSQIGQRTTAFGKAACCSTLLLRWAGPHALSDFIVRSGLSIEDRDTLARKWGFRSLLRIPDYTALLDQHGFDVLLAEDRTRAVAAQHTRATSGDQREWELDFGARHGEAETERLRVITEVWLNLVRAERAGYGMFVCRRREAVSTSVDGLSKGTSGA